MSTRPELVWSQSGCGGEITGVAVAAGKQVGLAVEGVVPEWTLSMASRGGHFDPASVVSTT
ncbi:hypothetical protein [Streptomyces hygroscopicus]|uniref:hypothetical protein n=1 Tax=Streptomyces hygroscopicus TaxID=1912 RepID=UPI000A83ECBB|nr:hypothetical protein [Streptomyces hygroscopicus]